VERAAGLGRFSRAGRSGGARRHGPEARGRGSRRAAACRRQHGTGTSVETMQTRRNVESMSISGSPRVDLSYGAKKTVAGGGSLTAEWSSAGFNGWRPEKLRFPATWSMRLAKEGSRRKLGR